MRLLLNCKQPRLPSAVSTQGVCPRGFFSRYLHPSSLCVVPYLVASKGRCYVGGWLEGKQHGTGILAFIASACFHSLVTILASFTFVVCDLRSLHRWQGCYQRRTLEGGLQELRFQQDLLIASLKHPLQSLQLVMSYTIHITLSAFQHSRLLQPGRNTSQMD